MKTRRLAVPSVSSRGRCVQGGKGTGTFNNKNMARKETSKREETASVPVQVLEELKELREEVCLAIEAASNASYRLMDAEELCRAMQISRQTLRRYEKQLLIPERKVGNKKFYLAAEVKNCIVTALRLWKE